MSLVSIFSKLNESVAIYEYLLDSNQKLVLFVKRDWAQDNQLIVRSFFVNYCGVEKKDKKGLDRLKEVIKILKKAGAHEMMGILIDGKIMYVAGINVELWIIRRMKVERLLLCGDEMNSLSGWLKDADLLVPLLGNLQEETVSRRLLYVALQLKKLVKGVNPEVLFRSAGFKYVAGMIQIKEAEDEFQKEIRKSMVVEDSVLRKKPVIVFFFKDWSFMFRVWHRRITAPVKRVVQIVLLPIGRMFESVVNRLPTQDAVYAIETRLAKGRARSRNQKIVMVLAISLLMGLSTSIGFGLKERKTLEWRQKFGGLMEEINYKLAEGKNLAELNPTRSRELVSQAGNLMNTLKQRGLPVEEVINLEQQLGLVLGLASGKRDVEVKTWLSFGLVREGMQAEDMRMYGEQLVLLDKGDDRVFVIGLKDKSAKIIAGREQVGDALQVTKYADKIYVLSDKGMLELSEQGDKLLFPFDSEWGKVIDMKMYTGNIYLLTSTGIWKYPVIESGFGEKQQWLVDAVDLPIDGVSMDIDGFIWVGENNGLRKFARGVEDSFLISGLEDGFEGIKGIFVSEESAFLYVLEPAKSRVVVLDKETGSYKSQYLNKEFTNATNLIVREAENQMLVLAGNKIFEVEL